MAYLNGSRSTFPEQIDLVKELYDLSPRQLQSAERYQELKTKEDRTSQEDEELNNLTIELQEFMPTAENCNKAFDMVIATQKHYRDNTIGHVNKLKQETTDYVDTKQNEMNTYVDDKKAEIDVEINKFQYRGVYSPDIKYFQRNIVDFNDGSGTQAYLCIKDSLGNEPTNSIYFKKLTIKGERGERGFDGVGLKFKGEWNSTTSYVKDDGVQFGGILFASLIDGNMDNTPDLTQDTPYWAKALDVTVTVRKMIGTRNIATQTSNVNFITGEITSFNPSVDSLEVYQNSIRLTKGIDYNINSNNQSIDKIVDIWDASSENTIFFEFVVTKNILNDLVFSDGSSIANGTVAKNKLTTDIQDDIDKISILSEKVSPETPLNTTSQDLSNAINEINLKAGKIGMKEVDETDIKDNYTVRYDGKTDKVVWVRSEIDRVPPAPVTNIKVKEDNTKVIITYTTPSDDDYMGTRLVYKTDNYPTEISDGTVIGNYISGTEITGLTNDITYYFRLFPYDTSNNYNTDTSQQITATPTEQRIYGIEIDEANSNPDTRVTYTDDAVGFTPASGNDGNFNWGSWENIVKEEFQIKPCILQNKQVNYYLNHEDYTKKTDGTNSNLTGTDGDVMVEFGISIYYKWATIGDIQKIQVSTKYFNGAVKYAHEVEDGYNQMPYYPLLLTQILFPLIFKSTNSQTALGRGRVDGAEYINTGNTDTKGFMYGSTKDEQMKFLGIEDYWGNKYQWIDGLVTDASYNLLIGNSGFNDSGSGYTNHASGVSANTAGYIDTVQGGNDKGFIIKGKAGSETTHYCDYGYLYSSRVAYFGGHHSNGSFAGFAYLRLANSVSVAAADVGSRLFCKNNGKLYIGAYLGTTQGGKLRSVSGTTPSDTKTISAFRNEARANNV